MKLIECEKCAAYLKTEGLEPGAEILCDDCRSVNVVPPRISAPRAVNLLARLTTFIWYVGLVLLVLAVMAMILTGNKSFWYEMDPDMSLSIPVEVALDTPQRFGLGFMSAGIQHVLLEGYEKPIIDRLITYEPNYWYALILAWGCLILWIVYEIRMLMESVRKGYSFSPRSPNRIRRIAVAVLIYIVFANLSDYWIYAIYSEYLKLSSAKVVAPSISLHPELIILSVTLFVIAYVFEWGRRLQVDYDHTV